MRNVSDSKISRSGKDISIKFWELKLMSYQEIAEKIEFLKSRVREVQKYELMTTNQYRDQVAIIIEILDEFLQFIKEK